MIKLNLTTEQLYKHKRIQNRIAVNKYALKNKDKIKIKNHNLYLKDKVRIDKRNQVYFTKHLKESPKFRIGFYFRQRIYKALKNQNTFKKAETIELLGCTFEELKNYLQSKFITGMNWKNYSYKGWHIDHIKPLSAFDLTKEDEQRIAFHYTNLQPLWAKENFVKHSTW